MHGCSDAGLGGLRHWFMTLVNAAVLTEIWLYTGSAKCIWHVQKFELFGYEINKKEWSSYDLFMFWSYDPKWAVFANSPGK